MSGGGGGTNDACGWTGKANGAKLIGGGPAGAQQTAAVTAGMGGGTQEPASMPRPACLQAIIRGVETTTSPVNDLERVIAVGVAKVGVQLGNDCAENECTIMGCCLPAGVTAATAGRRESLLKRVREGELPRRAFIGVATGRACTRGTFLTSPCFGNDDASLEAIVAF